MPEVNFYLKKGEGNPPRSLVYLQMRYHGQKFVYSCKFNIQKSNWDDKKQQVKTRSQTDKTGEVNLNDLLAGLKDECLRAYNTELAASGIPTKDKLKKHLDAYMNRSLNKQQVKKDGPSLYTVIDNFIAGNFDSKKKKRTAGTIRTYKTAKMHLEGFANSEKTLLDFDTINLDFYYKYTTYLAKDRGTKPVIKGLSQNSIAKEIKNVKTFMNKALQLEYTTNTAFKKKAFAIETEETDSVYLSETELRDLYKFDFTNNKRLEQVRDLFIFSSFVGLRYSDASNIKPENIIKMDGDDYIKITPQKTGKSVTIPCNDMVLDIFKKYKHNKNQLPPAISNQKYNDYLKEACRLAGLIETGRLASDLNKPLWACISSHTARRNFCTNLYLDGVSVITIMNISGHKTEKAFMRYIKVSRDESAKNLNKHLKATLSAKMLKAVS
ncbi:MAG: site-specific integrase [Ferruginibacter sp.]